MGGIMLSWIISPVVAGLLAGAIYVGTRKYVMEADNHRIALERQKVWVAGIAGLTVALAALLIGLSLSDRNATNDSIIGVLIPVTMFGVAAAVYWLILPRIFVYNVEDLNSHLLASGSVLQQGSTESLVTETSVDVELTQVKAHDEDQTESVSQEATLEKNFEIVQVLTACYVAFSQGAQDISNGILTAPARVRVLLGILTGV